jgi:hypothetical protein
MQSNNSKVSDQLDFIFGMASQKNDQKIKVSPAIIFNNNKTNLFKNAYLIFYF